METSITEPETAVFIPQTTKKTSPDFPHAKLLTSNTDLDYLSYHD